MKGAVESISITCAEVPPYRYRRPGMSPDKAAIAAVRELGISHLSDALGLLWELRREARKEETEGAE